MASSPACLPIPSFLSPGLVEKRAQGGSDRPLGRGRSVAFSSPACVAQQCRLFALLSLCCSLFVLVHAVAGREFRDGRKLIRASTTGSGFFHEVKEEISEEALPAVLNEMPLACSMIQTRPTISRAQPSVMKRWGIACSTKEDGAHPAVIDKMGPARGAE